MTEQLPKKERNEQIAEQLSRGIPASYLAKQYGVTRQLIYEVARKTKHKQMLEKAFEPLRLDYKTMHALYKGGYKSAEQVYYATFKELSRVRNIGEKTLKALGKYESN